MTLKILPGGEGRFGGFSEELLQRAAPPVNETGLVVVYASLPVCVFGYGNGKSKE
jgi:hypothetical protein